MRYFLIICFFFALPLLLLSQETKFNKIYHWSGSETSSNVFLNGQGYQIIGSALDSASGNGGFGFLFLDSAGQQINKKTFGMPSAQYQGCYAILNTDSSIVISSQIYKSGDYDATLIKFDKYGDTIWTRNYPDTLVQAGSGCARANDGGYILTGWNEKIISGSSQTQCLLIKTDSIGGFQWKKSIGNSSVADEGHYISNTNDGGYIIGGSTFFSSFQPCIIKVDSGGNTQWTRKISTNWYGSITCVKQTFDGGYLAVGCIADSGNTGWNFTKALIVKLFPNGNVDWIRKDYSPNSVPLDAFSEVIQLHDSSYVLSGTMMTDTASHYLNTDGILFHISNLGDILWKRRFDKTGGYNKGEYFARVVQTVDSGFISCGSFSQAPFDFWVVKTDSYGCDSAGCQFTGIPEMQEIILKNAYCVYPNPVQNELSILNNEYGKSSGKENSEFKLYDILGRCVFKSTIQGELEIQKIHFTELNNGMYFYSIFQNKVKIQSEKLIVVQ